MLYDIFHLVYDRYHVMYISVQHNATNGRIMNALKVLDAQYISVEQLYDIALTK